MSTAKEDVHLLLRDLPDTSTLEDIQYHLYVIAKIRSGLNATEQFGIVSHDEVEEGLLQWLSTK